MFPRTWTFGEQTWSMGEFPRIMGIVNVTPDSFSDGGAWFSPAQAVDHALELTAQCADILDIGGESTRPGAEAVSVQEELKRVIPVIERLAPHSGVPISIDTMKAEVAEAALAAGASIINDVTGFEFDPRMIEVASHSNCGVIIMHMQGCPQNMQDSPQYGDVVQEVTQYLQQRAAALIDAGIDHSRIVIDPGIGFGKTAEHNVQLLANLDQLHATGFPVLIGHSRKRFLGKVINRPVEERLSGTIGVSIAVAEQGADILRVHDVASVRDALTAWQVIREHGT